MVEHVYLAVDLQRLSPAVTSVIGAGNLDPRGQVRAEHHQVLRGAWDANDDEFRGPRAWTEGSASTRTGLAAARLPVASTVCA